MGLQRRGARTEHGAKAYVKNGEHSAARGSSCVLELHVYKLAGEGVRDGSSVTERKDRALGKGLLLKMASILPRAGVRACSNEVASCLQARPVLAALLW